VHGTRYGLRVLVSEHVDHLLDRALERWRRVPSLVADAALAAVVGLVTVVSVMVQDRNEPEDLRLLGVVLLVAQTVPLVWRRQRPVVVLAIVAGATLIYGAAELPDPPLQFAILLAFYTVGAHTPRSVSVRCAVAMVVGGIVTLALARDSDAADVAVSFFAAATAWVTGDAARTQRERAVWLEERRVDAARQAAADERLRIARDLHDIVAHHVSVMAVQAEAAQEVLAARPDRAERAMSDVADTARATLGELRRLLGVLRADGDRAPQPDLDGVGDLVESVRRTGLAVEVHTEGEPRPVAGLAGVTAYRVVQEALTNVIKHASAARADVELRFGDEDLVVTVTDDGRGSGGSGGSAGDLGGHGLAGMRERLAVLGGTLDAGPCPGGGFSVRARLPLGAQ
jgi:signal transduction histidine kinase